MCSGAQPAELTWRGLLLGAALTLLFTAANVYLGLKVGLTFATSIPAAVISMAVLRHLPGATVLENNIVQTVASAAGTLSCIIFVLPGLVMIGWWHGFPWLTTAGITATGGILGVMLSVPLRRALMVDSDLPYPEGRAAAEVLALGTQGAAGQADSALGLRILVWNSLASAGFAVLAQTRLVLDSAALWFRVGAGATGIAGNLSFALLGVGHLVGLSVGAAMALGLVIGWAVLVPILTAQQPIPDVGVEAWVGAAFRQEVRFFGAGVMGVAALWTLIRIARPVLGGIRSAFATGRARQAGATLALEERDLPIAVVLLVSTSLLLPIGWLLWDVLAGTSLERHGVLLVAGGPLFVLVIGLVVAAVTGYMAGLIGSSNSPLSGIGILAALASSAMLLGLLGRDGDAQSGGALVAYVLTVTGIVFSICAIANDNLQDLKTGQLVGATPWKQQAALVVGVVFGSAIIPAGAQRAGDELRLRRDARGRAERPGRAAGRPDLDPGQGRALGRGQLAHAGLGRGRGPGAGRAGDPRPAEASPPAPAGHRLRDLPAHEAGRAPGGRCGDRHGLRALGAPPSRSGAGHPAGHPDGDRADRRREPLGRRLRADRLPVG